MALFKNDRFVANEWKRLAEGESLPSDGHVILTVAQADALASSLANTNVPLGLALTSDIPVETIATRLPRFSLVALSFPKFGDGRPYSMARQLRSRYGFVGELRATGEVLFDELQFMARCGFNSFEITDPATVRLLESGRHDKVDLYYQPGFGAEVSSGTRPWARRRQG